MDAITCEPMVDQQVLHSDLYEVIRVNTAAVTYEQALALFRALGKLRKYYAYRSVSLSTPAGPDLATMCIRGEGDSRPSAWRAVSMGFESFNSMSRYEVNHLRHILSSMAGPPPGLKLLRRYPPYIREAQGPGVVQIPVWNVMEPHAQLMQAPHAGVATGGAGAGAGAGGGGGTGPGGMALPEQAWSQPSDEDLEDVGGRGPLVAPPRPQGSRHVIGWRTRHWRRPIPCTSEVVLCGEHLPSSCGTIPWTACLGREPIMMSVGAHTHGTSLVVITASGMVLGVGSNESGQLGLGVQYLDYLFPTPMPIMSLCGKQAFLVVCGARHTLVLTRNNGNHDVYAFGHNMHGECGVGLVTDTIHKPVKLQQVSGRRVKVVACGRSFTLLTLFQSSAPEKQLSYAWGANWHGQLGMGHTMKCYVPTPIPSMAQYHVRRLACGPYSSIAAVTLRGESRDRTNILVWGRDFQTQDDARTRHINSWPIVAGLPRQRIRAVAAGDMHFAVLTHRDSLYMWGHNWHGQLGFEDPAPVPRPRRLAAFTNRGIHSVTCGQTHTMVLTASGEVWAFGACRAIRELSRHDHAPVKLDALCNRGLRLVASALMRHDLVLYTDPRIVVRNLNWRRRRDLVLLRELRARGRAQVRVAPRTDYCELVGGNFVPYTGQAAAEAGAPARKRQRVAHPSAHTVVAAPLAPPHHAAADDATPHMAVAPSTLPKPEPEPFHSVAIVPPPPPPPAVAAVAVAVPPPAPAPTLPAAASRRVKLEPADTLPATGAAPPAVPRNVLSPAQLRALTRASSPTASAGAGPDTAVQAFTPATIPPAAAPVPAAAAPGHAGAVGAAVPAPALPARPAAASGPISARRKRDRPTSSSDGGTGSATTFSSELLPKRTTRRLRKAIGPASGHTAAAAAAVAQADAEAGAATPLTANTNSRPRRSTRLSPSGNGGGAAAAGAAGGGGAGGTQAAAAAAASTTTNGASPNGVSPNGQGSSKRPRRARRLSAKAALSQKQ